MECLTENALLADSQSPFLQRNPTSRTTKLDKIRAIPSMRSARSSAVHTAFAVWPPGPSQSARSASARIRARATVARRANSAPSMWPVPTIASLLQCVAIFISQESARLFQRMPVDVPGNATPMPTVVETTSAAATAADSCVCILLVQLSRPGLRLQWSPIRAMPEPLWNPRRRMSLMSRQPSAA